MGKKVFGPVTRRDAQRCCKMVQVMMESARALVAQLAPDKGVDDHTARGCVVAVVDAAKDMCNRITSLLTYDYQDEEECVEELIRRSIYATPADEDDESPVVEEYGEPVGTTRGA